LSDVGLADAGGTGDGGDHDGGRRPGGLVEERVELPEVPRAAREPGHVGRELRGCRRTVRRFTRRFDERGFVEPVADDIA